MAVLNLPQNQYGWTIMQNTLTKSFDTPALEFDKLVLYEYNIHNKIYGQEAKLRTMKYVVLTI